MLRLPSFTYLQPSTLAEAVRLKADAGPDGAYVAGGTDLYPNMKRRQQEPRTVISLMKIPELRASDSRTVGRSDGGIVLGAGLTLTELSDSPTVRQSVEVVSRAAELVSTPLLRRRGSFDFPVLGVAVWLRWDARRVAAARLVLGGVASLPQEVAEAGAVLTGTDLSDEAIAAAAEAAYRPAKPLDNTDFGLS